MTDQNNDQGYETPVVDDANDGYGVEQPTTSHTEVPTEDEAPVEKTPTYARSSSNTDRKSVV